MDKAQMIHEVAVKTAEIVTQCKISQNPDITSTSITDTMIDAYFHAVNVMSVQDDSGFPVD